MADERTKIGIDGVDELTKGGIPSGNMVVVSGNPGSGKTIFCLQYLYNGAKHFKEPGVFISLEEDRNTLIEDAKDFGWDLAELEKKKLLLINKLELYDFEKLKSTIEDSVDKVRAKRLVIDPGVILKLYFEKDLEMRKGILELGSLLKKLGCTTLFTSEPEGEQSALFGMESYVADGVILLYHTKLENEFVRTIAVLKMRGTSISEKLHPLKITSKGIDVLSQQEVFQDI